MCDVAERLENVGIEKGIEQGESNLIKLYQLLTSEGKTMELDKAMKDATYRKELMHKLGII